MAGAPSNHPPFGRLLQRRLSSLALPVKAPPPLLVSFESLDDALEAMPERFREAIGLALRRLVTEGLPPALSVGVVATLFGVSVAFVRAMVTRPQRYYREFVIRKGTKRRRINAPKVALKAIQSWIGFHMARAVRLADCVYGFVPGRNGVVEAANVHCGARWVYSLDLRNFFPSISSEQVAGSLRELGYSDNAAACITLLCTLDGALPQGSPASPVLSNLAFARTDQDLVDIAVDAGVRYTRYADDLVFSGIGELPQGLQQSVRDCIAQHGWEIAVEKEHLAVLPRRLKVHGLLVQGTKPRLTKGYRNRVRAYRHLVEAGRVRPEDAAKIAGHLAYALQVEKGSNL